VSISIKKTPALAGVFDSAIGVLKNFQKVLAKISLMRRMRASPDGTGGNAVRFERF